MRSPRLLILPMTLLSLTACLDVGSDHRQDENDESNELFNNRAKTGSITTVGEVDWYEFQPTASDSQISIEVLSNTLRSDIELLVTMYQKDSTGELVRLYADHAPEDAVNGAEIEINYLLNNDETVHISVRDLMDDESATGNYSITVQEGQNDQDNDVLDGAETLTVNGTCLSDRIDSIGDVDMFQFSLDTAAVTQVSATQTMSSPTTVDLRLSLYGADTTLIESWSHSQDNVFFLQHYLEAGTYTLAIDDFGRDDLDLSAPFSVCITTVDDLEAMEDDEEATATSVDLTSSDQNVTGSIGHQTDEDWFILSLPSENSSDLQLLSITLEANDSDHDLQYIIKDENGDVVFSYVQTAGSAAYNQQFIAGEGQHSMSVMLAEDEWLEEPADYSVDFEIISVSDDQETGSGNNTLSNATELTLGTTATGKISYRGDLDWYELEVPPLNDEYQVLELSLASSDESPVEYRMQILLDDVTTAIDDPITTDNVLSLSKAILVSPLSPDDTDSLTRYYIKVSDVYAEKSDAFATYDLQASVRALHSFDNDDLPSQVESSDLVFADEDEELARLDANTNLAYLEVNGFATQVFAVDTDTLQHINPQAMAEHVTRTDNEDGTFSIEFPWLGGYIDYSGDQDWYAINLKELGIEVVIDEETADEEHEIGDIVVEYPDVGTDWHYQIQIDLISAEGEDSEYQWRLYRDQGQNKVVRDRPTSSGDGYLGQMGDSTLTTEAVNLSTAGQSAFWTSEDWSETFYLGISDFDFRTSPHTGSTNAVTDDDWSGEQTPYFVRISLTYVQGLHQPE